MLVVLVATLCWVLLLNVQFQPGWLSTKEISFWKATVNNVPNMVIQSSVVITRSNIMSCYIHDHRNCGKISIRCWIHKKTPIPGPYGRAMGCNLLTINCVIRTPHCFRRHGLFCSHAKYYHTKFETHGHYEYLNNKRQRQRCLTWDELCYFISVSNELFYLLITVSLS